MLGMEYASEALRSFIAGGFTNYLKSHEDSETPMNAVDTVVFGGVDLSRYDAKKVVCAVIADSDAPADSHISDAVLDCRFTVSFILRGYPASVLERQMKRYALALREALEANFTLGGRVSDCSCGKCEYFPDAGTVEKQMCAAETEVNVTVDNEPEGPFA